MSDSNIQQGVEKQTQSYGQLDKQKERKKDIKTYKQNCYFSHLLLYAMHQQFLNVTIGL
jgi:hypothetical protein